MKKIYLITLSIFLNAWINNLQAQSDMRSLIIGEKGKTAHFTSIPAGRQVAFVPSKAKELLGIDKNSDLVQMNSETDLVGNLLYRCYQTYLGIPIENTMYILHTKNGKLTGMSGEIVIDFDKQLQMHKDALLKAESAIEIAIKYVNAEVYVWELPQMEKQLREQTGNTTATNYPSASLVWYSLGEEIDVHGFKLAYKIDVYAKQPLSCAYYFVDANTGKVLGKKNQLDNLDVIGSANTAYSGPPSQPSQPTIHSDQLSLTNYRLRDYSNPGMGGIITLHGEPSLYGNDYSYSSNNWTLNGTDQYALDAHYGVSQTYLFYKTLFNRNSVDNLGLALTSFVNDPIIDQNGAGWRFSTQDMHFGTLNNISFTAIDITGHELTHGVTQFTSILKGNLEAKSIAESMGDIMGKSILIWSKPNDVNWVFGNDLNLSIRNMANPLMDFHPDTYEMLGWDQNNPDVHVNAGVGDKMFYLLVNGGSDVNGIDSSYTVHGIGLMKADSILYQSEIGGDLFTTARYPDWRYACFIAASDIYGINSNEVSEVMNAWYAVGIGAHGFKVASPNGGGTLNQGTKQEITWDPAYTNDTPDPQFILYPDVKISLSTDGGVTFPIVLEANTPNDGIDS